MPPRGKGFEERVRRHFRSGICELTSMAGCLSRAPKDHREYQKAKEHTQRVSEELPQAEELAEQELQRVDSETLKTMALRKKLTDEQKKKKEDLTILKARLDHLGRQLQENLETVTSERSKKKKAKQELAEEEAKKQYSLEKVALWLMLIPAVGTVIGIRAFFSVGKGSGVEQPIKKCLSTLKRRL